LTRFTGLATAMGVGRLDMVATAAVREASDGAAFVAEVERRFGLGVRVLSGAEEARLAALGVLSGVPDADGVLGDLGGGSLDLVALEAGVCGDAATLPLGHLRVAEVSAGDPGRAGAVITEHLAGVGWLDVMAGRSLYAVGGSWRALARIFIEQIGYPLHVVDNYVIGRDEAERLAGVVAGLGPASIGKIPGIPRRRLETVPFAAAILRALIEVTAPRRLVFSGFSMREGQLLSGLPEALRRQDPLISACTGLAERTGRFSIRGEEILDWMTPLFPDETATARRLRLAACLLSDIGWTEHPDYRAQHAFHRVLRVPFAGLDHGARVLLALAVFVRYNGDIGSALVAPVRNLLDEATRARAETVGLALRLAHTLSGSAPGLLARTRLEIRGGRLALGLPTDSDIFVSETVERRFRTLARVMGLKGRIDAPAAGG
jgi:exopolyphosphatase/guanosine-5'-triphosphate,3'-diphosphate pyrophosphatase